MRTKLFLSFLCVLIIALASNLIYERLTIRDFEDYVRGTKQDHVYWILASVEGSYRDGTWNISHLSNSVHWALMLGYEAEVLGEGRAIINSSDVIRKLSDVMKRRMQGAIGSPPEGEFEEYPLFVEAEEIGTLRLRALKMTGALAEREEVFRKRGLVFLLISFFIAGSGAALISILFSVFLTRPLRRLKDAAESIQRGDLSVRVSVGSKDEVGLLSESFNKMVETIQREDSFRRHLTQNIAHELRTPLSIIKAHIEAIEDGVVKPKEGLLSIKSETERLIRLIEGIEDITRAEASFFRSPVFERARLWDFLNGIVLSLKPLFEAKGLYINIDGDPALEGLLDLGKLETAVRNILSNSLRHTEKGGVEISYRVLNGTLSIDISDTGEGISEEDLKKVFGRFWSKGGGLGLGLSISKELIESMGGSIDIKSTPGKGTKIQLLLALHKEGLPVH